MGYEVPNRPRTPLFFGAVGLILLVAAAIPQLWAPEGAFEPTWRLIALFAAVGLLAGALGAFNRWVVADRNARRANFRSTLGASRREQEFDNPPTTYPLGERQPDERADRQDRP